jgi:20S proteasome subunit alpha 4
VCTLIAGIDGVKGEPRLFLTEPSGVYSEWYAAAIGRSSKSVREFLEAHYTTDVGSPNGGNGDDGNGPRELGMLCKELTMAAGVKLAVRALLEVVQSGAQFVEVATLDLQGSVRFLPEADVKALIEDLERSAQQSSSTLAPQQ